MRCSAAAETETELMDIIEGKLEKILTAVEPANDDATALGALAVNVDFAAITAINLKMMNELANHYDVEFKSVEGQQCCWHWWLVNPPMGDQNWPPGYRDKCQDFTVSS